MKLIMVPKCRLLFVCCAFSCISLQAQLNSGDIMFIAYDADVDDGFAIVALVDLDANSTIYFTEKEWNGLPIDSGGGFNTDGEGRMTWITGTAAISAGTVVVFQQIQNSGRTVSIGSISTAGTWDLSVADEVLYAFSGTDDLTPTTFLSAIANNEFNATNGEIANTGLSIGADAISFSGGLDIMVYSGMTSCNSTLEDCAAMIANTSNWISQNATGDQSQDSILPDFPDDVVASFNGSALPVDLLSFTANEDDGRVAVEWSTASELNNDYFMVQRSVDGINFNVIGTVDGNGTTSEFHKYYFTDANPKSGVSYYRLKQVDFDGAFE